MKFLYFFIFILLQFEANSQTENNQISITGNILGDLINEKKYLYYWLKGDNIDIVKKTLLQKNKKYSIIINNEESKSTADLYFFIDSNLKNNNSLYSSAPKIIISQLKYTAINELKLYNIKIQNDLVFNDIRLGPSRIQAEPKLNSMEGTYAYQTKKFNGWIKLKEDNRFEMQKVLDSTFINGEEGYWIFQNNTLILNTTTSTNKYIGIYTFTKKTRIFTKNSKTEDFIFLDKENNKLEKNYLPFEIRKDTSKIKLVIKNVLLEKNQITVIVNNQSDFPINNIKYQINIRNKKTNQTTTKEVIRNFVDSSYYDKLKTALFPKLSTEMKIMNIQFDTYDEEEDTPIKSSDFEVSVKIIEYWIYK